MTIQPSRLRTGGIGVATCVTTFSSALGWMGVLWAETRVSKLTFGHETARFAAQALGSTGSLMVDRWTGQQQMLIERLQAFSEGVPDDFLDVRLDMRGLTGFQERVTYHCRRIPFGTICTYAELAERAGSPTAARAVGNVMSANRFPLVVPCHRVIGARGRLGGYSATMGLAMKVRLLRREGHAVAVSDGGGRVS